MIELRGIYKNTFDGRPVAIAPTALKPYSILPLICPFPLAIAKLTPHILTIHTHYEYNLRATIKI